MDEISGCDFKVIHDKILNYFSRGIILSNKDHLHGCHLSLVDSLRDDSIKVLFRSHNVLSDHMSE